MWDQQFQITSLLVNSQGKLGLFGALNLLQETAWGHAESLGFGMSAMEKENYMWVVTRQTLSMQQWPRYGEKISITTWLRPPEGAFVTREFLIRTESGELLGSCSTSWLALNRDSRKIIPVIQLRPWDQIAFPESTGLTTEKVPAEGVFEKLAKFRVRNSDLDINQHVNNTKYSQWILDSVSFDLHKKLILKGYTVNFLAETHLGDEVRIEINTASPTAETANAGQTIYRGIRVSDDRVLFTAALSWEKKV